jgi:phage gpG-like protein
MFQIMIEGDEDIFLGLDLLSLDLANMVKPTQEALELASASVLENIALSGRPEYDDILAASRRQRKFDTGTPPLWDSGEMAAAATATSAGVAGSTYFLSPDGNSGNIGVDDLFHGARRHQFGFDGPDALGRTFNEPARAFMVFQAEDIIKTVEIFDLWLGAIVAGK